MAGDDGDTIDSIVEAVYAVLSGPAGERDWNRFAALFLPGARLVRVTRAGDAAGRGEDAPVATSMDVAGYREDTAEQFRREPFYEVEICRRTERFGSIAHVCSTFEARRAAGAAPFKRGLSSIQLFHDGRRWWVVGILWQNEDPSAPLPSRYLPAAGG